MDSKRSYRIIRSAEESGLVFFRVAVKESDLLIGVDRGSYHPRLPAATEDLVWRLRQQLEAYIAQDPHFRSALEPYLLPLPAPPIARLMNWAAWQANVGPMAAVAGAFAETVGGWLAGSCAEVLVENGGDLYIQAARPRLVAIWAGDSVLSGKLALEIAPADCPLGVCTSSGTVGPSYSAGKADAAVVVASSAALADAAASAVGNAVQSEADIEAGLAAARKITGVAGAVVIKADRLGAWGQVRLVPLT